MRFDLQERAFVRNLSRSSVESASRTTLSSIPIKEAPAVVLKYGEDAGRRAGPKDRARGADSTELWD
jgi:hypothetical protein